MHARVDKHTGKTVYVNEKTNATTFTRPLGQSGKTKAFKRKLAKAFALERSGDLEDALALLLQVTEGMDLASKPKLKAKIAALHAKVHPKEAKKQQQVQKQMLLHAMRLHKEGELAAALSLFQQATASMNLAERPRLDSKLKALTAECEEKGLTAKLLHEPHDLAHGWREKVDPASGKTFYVHDEHQKTEWTRPINKREGKEEKEGPLPEEWREEVNPASGQPFYVHDGDQITQWVRPKHTLEEEMMIIVVALLTQKLSASCEPSSFRGQKSNN